MMEGNKNQPRALLMFGAPCCGKTTFSEKFAKRFNMTIFNLEDIAAQYNIGKKMVFIILTEVARTGQNLIIESHLETEKAREEVRNILRKAGYLPSTIWIQTDTLTIRSRLKSRYGSIPAAKEAYETALNELEPPTGIEQPIIISGKHTFETQLKHVLAGLAK